MFVEGCDQHVVLCCAGRVGIASNITVSGCVGVVLGCSRILLQYLVCVSYDSSSNGISTCCIDR